MEQLLAERDQQLAEATRQPKTSLEKAKSAFKVPKGEENYVHAYVTHLNGVEQVSPQVQPFHPAAYKALTQPGTGFKAEVFHQPKAN